MRTGDGKCFGCNRAYLNCYQTCPNSPARNNDISLTPIQTSNLERYDNCYKREMHIKTEVAREFIEAVDSMIELVSAMIGLDIIVFGGKYAELKKKYEGERK